MKNHAITAVAVILVMVGCNSNDSKSPPEKSKMPQTDDYRKNLSAAKASYPFSKWAKWGIEQHTGHAIDLFTSVFDRLIERLAELGEQAPEPAKLGAFRQAVEALNGLNKRNEILIETDEREDLCTLFNIIAKAARIDPSKYGGGEGPASEWRDW
jgi:hypothetical protein